METYESARRESLFDGRPVAELCKEAFGCVPTEMHLLGEDSNDCRAFKLRVNNEKIKCYECESEERAKMVGQATQFLLNDGVPIPRILAVVGHVVFAEWISGKPLAEGHQQSVWRKLAAYQARIHRASVSLQGECRDHFIHLDWLLRRLVSASKNYVCPKYVQSLSERLLELIPPGLKAGIIQPDFIKSNIVVSDKAELVIVDNELLGIGLGFEFDILNASYVISGGDTAKQRGYLEAYAEVGDLGTLEGDFDFWELCYLAKLAGKRFLLNDLTIANVCLELLDRKLQAHPRGQS